MLPTPKKFKVVAGAAEGSYQLTAFDHALLESGIGNINLVRVSSILPPGAQQDQDLILSPGSLVPTAYAAISCNDPGTLISAAVGVGLSEDSFGVIMEYSGYCSRSEAERRIEEMLKEAFKIRGLALKNTIVRGVEHSVEKNGAAVAAVVLWY